MQQLFSWIILLLLPASLLAAEGRVPLKVQEVAPHIYALVGEMSQRSPENLGNNATFGVIVTTQGVVLIDSGGSEKGAAQIHQTIKTITDKPVVLVINSGGQDHRWLGNHYFKQQGAKIIASAAAVQDQQARASGQMAMLETLIGKQNLQGTQPVYADDTFETARDLQLGDVHLQLRHAGQAHTPGDSYIWLPQSKVVFTGDIVYVERMLGVGSMSNSASWLKVFAAMAAHQPQHVIPGHGHATDLATARKDTADYLQMLRDGVAGLIDAGGGLEAVSQIDQSRFQYLKVYDELKGRNAHQVFQEMEWQ